MISRRKFLKNALGFAAGLVFGRPAMSYGSLFPHFFFTQLKYKGGEWDPNPMYAGAIVEELELRTSIDATRERRIIEPSDPELFYSPLLYMAGRYEFEPFSEPEREILKRFILYGGFILAEDTVGAKGFGFDRSFRREMEKILPNGRLERLLPGHSVYQSFYLIGSIGGRQHVNSYLEGITIKNWTPVIYSQNDLSGAWSKDKYGKWLHACMPGEELQRKAAFKTGINIIVYALTSDYKRDLIHHPFIKRRQNL